jgi:hypothetical protein
MSSCETDFCDKFYKKMWKKNPFVIYSRTYKKKYNAQLRKDATKRWKRDRVTCISRYCNPTCKDTLITEKKDTPAMKKEFKEYLDYMSDSLANRKATTKDLDNYKKTVRKMVKKYNPPLENGFYKGLLSSEIKMLKEGGATSGCTVELHRHIKDHGLWSRFKRDMKSGSIKETAGYLVGYLLD